MTRSFSINTARALAQATFALVVVSCTTEPSSGPLPSSSARASTTALASATASDTSASSAPTAPDAQGEPTDTWLVVNGEGIELGVIELRAGKPPMLIPSTQSEAVTQLEARLRAVGGAAGIGLDMHLPPPDGTGRGPSGTVIVKWNDPRYRHALKQKLEPEYSIRELPEIRDPLPPAIFKALQVWHSGKKVGAIDFSTSPPKLSLDAQGSDGSSLKNDLDQVVALGELTVRYHHKPSDAGAELVTVRAKPSDDRYAQAVALYLMAERYYTTRYAYELKFDDSSSAAETDECQKLRAAVLNEAKKLTACQTDAECVVHRTVICGFAELDCYGAHVNKAGNAAALDEAVGAYAAICPLTKCKCAVPSKSVCRSGKCAAE